MPTLPPGYEAWARMQAEIHPENWNIHGDDPSKWNLQGIPPEIHYNPGTEPGGPGWGPLHGKNPLSWTDSEGRYYATDPGASYEKAKGFYDWLVSQGKTGMPSWETLQAQGKAPKTGEAMPKVNPRYSGKMDAQGYLLDQYGDRFVPHPNARTGLGAFKGDVGDAGMSSVVKGGPKGGIYDLPGYGTGALEHGFQPSAASGYREVSPGGWVPTGPVPIAPTRAFQGGLESTFGRYAETDPRSTASPEQKAWRMAEDARWNATRGSPVPGMYGLNLATPASPASTPTPDFSQISQLQGGAPMSPLQGAATGPMPNPATAGPTPTMPNPLFNGGYDALFPKKKKRQAAPTYF